MSVHDRLSAFDLSKSLINLSVRILSARSLLTGQAVMVSGLTRSGNSTNSWIIYIVTRVKFSSYVHILISIMSGFLVCYWAVFIRSTLYSWPIWGTHEYLSSFEYRRADLLFDCISLRVLDGRHSVFIAERHETFGLWLSDLLNDRTRLF